MPYPLLSVKKIWDKADHSAFTDLIFYKDQFYCAFRESSSHQDGTRGLLRIITSPDAMLWKSASLISDPVDDLRDPKLSIDPIGRLVLNCGVLTQEKELGSRIAFSPDGVGWTALKPILPEHEWLWRLTWRRGYAYGVTYRKKDPTDPKSQRQVALYRTRNGLEYEKITDWDVPGYPSEVTLRFKDDETMVALVRRDGRADRVAWVGESQPPYDAWNWQPLNMHLGAPDFLILDDQTLLASGRLLTVCPYGFMEKTILGEIEGNRITSIQVLPSSLDCSYPGMVIKEQILYLSYYSSHEDKSAIYLARFSM